MKAVFTNQVLYQPVKCNLIHPELCLNIIKYGDVDILIFDITQSIASKLSG